MMTSLIFLLAAILGAVVTPCRGQADSTKTPNVYGTDVVEAAVTIIKSNCIFSDDRQFLRRLAYVESLDGTDPDTYRDGYHGGIWKVSQSMLNATTSCGLVIRATCDAIKQNFSIDWPSVTWEDLRKPLYSALAASLYLMVRTGSSTPHVPPDLEGQGRFWAQYYRAGSPSRNFTTLAAQTTAFNCADAMDLVFIMDSSGSIIDPDFNLSLNFVAEVVEAMRVPDVVKVATLIFADVAKVEYYFKDNLTKTQVIADTRSIIRVTGGTETALALDAARVDLFNGTNGARSSVKRVAVLITDGQSSSITATTRAAQRLRDTGVTVFSIGVGSYNPIELKAVASPPGCFHVHTLTNYADIQSIIEEIQQSTCEAYITLANGTYTIQGNGTQTLTSGPNETVVVSVTGSCGIANVYTSYTNPNPSLASYEQMYIATEGHPAYLMAQVNANGRPVFLTVVGTKLPESATGLANCTDFNFTVSAISTDWELRCCFGQDECVSCTNEYLLRDPHVREVVCTNNPTEFSNPCSREAFDAGHIMFSYPYDPSKFIHCDYMGNPYITQCPRSETFNPTTQTCGYETPGTSTWVPLPDIDNNPCTPENIRAQNLYFAYAPDSHLFIQCNLWGEAFLRDCPVTEVWNQEELTCVAGDHNSAINTPGIISNPCTPEAISTGKFYFPYPCDHTRYIHCDITGTYWVQFCPGGLYYDPNTYVCVGNDPQFGAHGCD